MDTEDNKNRYIFGIFVFFYFANVEDKEKGEKQKIR
jgi:hypothetical protein